MGNNKGDTKSGGQKGLLRWLDGGVAMKEDRNPICSTCMNAGGNSPETVVLQSWPYAGLTVRLGWV